MAKCSTKAAQLTPELPGMPQPPKRRGRPPTGKAKTGAERQQAYRQRQAQAVSPVLGGLYHHHLVELHHVQDHLAALYAQVMAAYLDGEGHLDPKFLPWLEDFGNRLITVRRDLGDTLADFPRP